jgi:hypothetical protein
MTLKSILCLFDGNDYELNAERVNDFETLCLLV